MLNKRASESVIFSRTLYPKNCIPGYMGYMICLYRKYLEGEKQLPKAAGGDGFETIVAVGNGLPTTPKTVFVLNGFWQEGKKGPQLKVTNYDLPKKTSEEGIINYLTCGLFKGISKISARRIYRCFGSKTLDVLENDIDRIKEVPRITERNFNKFKESYLLNVGCNELAQLCYPFNISGNQIQKIYSYFGSEQDAINVFKTNPYRFCRICGVSFRTADEIAKKEKLNRNMPERVKEATLYALDCYENIGNTCIEGKSLCESVCKVCNYAIAKETRNIVLQPIKELVDRGVISKYSDKFFKNETNKQEANLAGIIARGLKHKPNKQIKDIDKHIANIQKASGISFASQQIEAVKTALNNDTCFSIITGGPGTGKSFIQKAILEVFCNQYPSSKVLCCSPTGKAARRMTESTGFPAQTIHSALGIKANEAGLYNEPEELDAELIIVDEVSMLDTFIASSLMSSVKNGCRVVFVGDSDQLPSVGAGSVLADLLETSVVPYVKLDRVFRQKSESLIAINAQKINKGLTDLSFGEDFQYIPCNNSEKAVDILVEEYEKAVEEQGLDGVILLSPFRKATETGVNALNQKIQERLNPERKNVKQIEYKDTVFREGDRVMQIKNFENVANGDVGTITKIYKDFEDGIGEDFIEIEFSDVTVKYTKEDLKMLDLAYSTTIHKSQGSEYHTVILTLQMVHRKMLNRPLIYTAVTRGKKRVIIVGEDKAIKTAIETNDIKKRITCLTKRINDKFIA